MDEITLPKRGTRAAFNDYESFIKKFEAKKTTDDCYTPQPIYDAILDYVFEKANLPEDTQIVRPFRPGGDYQAEEYPEGCVVVDNPPFSILAQIVGWYIARGVKFFLFAPTLTLFSAAAAAAAYTTKIVCGATITYANGASVNTSFLTNMWGDRAIICDGELFTKLEEIDTRLRAKASTAKVAYPACVTSAALLSKIPKRGVSLTIPFEECRAIKKIGKQAIFGGGYILSTKMTAAKVAAEEAAKVAAEEAAKATTIIPLSAIEQRIVDELDGRVKPFYDLTLF